MRTSIKKMIGKKNKTPIVMVTAYDAWMAKLVDDSVDCILVGDSLGMMIQGHPSTLPVTLEEMIYHTRMVLRGSEKALVITDLPFLSYQTSVGGAVQSAGECLKAGAQVVKLEGGPQVVPQIKAIVSYGIPVVGHLGLTPQSINLFGSFAKQGKTDIGANEIFDSAKAIEEAGVSMIVLENIPHDLAQKITENVSVPTVGIGAGANCDGQVQVFHDLMGLDPNFIPRHARQYMNGGEQIQNAVAAYAEGVRSKNFTSE